MKEVELKINNWQDRQNVITGLANSGYSVRVEVRKDKLWASDDEYFVIFKL